MEDNVSGYVKACCIVEPRVEVVRKRKPQVGHKDKGGNQTAAERQRKKMINT